MRITEEILGVEGLTCTWATKPPFRKEGRETFSCILFPAYESVICYCPNVIFKYDLFHNIFVTVLVKMVANHQHVQVLINGVASKWSSWVGWWWNYILFRTHFNDIRGMATTCTFGVIGVDCAALESPKENNNVRQLWWTGMPTSCKQQITVRSQASFQHRREMCFGFQQDASHSLWFSP